MKYLLSLGITLILISLLIIFIASFTSEKTDIKTAGSLFLGPFSLFSFFSDKKTIYILVALAVGLLLSFIIFILIQKWK